LYTSPNIIRVIKSGRMKWVEYVARMGKMGNAYKVLNGEREGKRPLGRPTSRWEDNIRMILREIVWDWIHLAQNRT